MSKHIDIMRHGRRGQMSAWEVLIAASRLVANSRKLWNLTSLNTSTVSRRTTRPLVTSKMKTGFANSWTRSSRFTARPNENCANCSTDPDFLRNREEYEPLGQFVRYTPPSDNPDTPPNPLPGSPLNDAKFPEWQCKLASGIGTPDNELPSHCKRAIEQDPGSMYTISWKEEGNPNKVTSFVDSPLPRDYTPDRGSTYAAKSAMGSALTSSSKPDSKKGKKSRSGQADEPLIDIGTFNVDAEKPDGPQPIEIPDFMDASVGAFVEDYQHLRDEYDKIGAIRDVINYAKSRKECDDAFRAVGATPIGEQLNNLTIVAQNLFAEPLHDNVNDWTRGTPVAKGMRETLKEHPGTKDVSTIGTYKYLRPDNTFVDSNHRFLGVTNAAFDGTQHLSVVIIHSLLHTGGVPGRKPSWTEQLSLKTTVETHDLTYLGSKYQDILKHCTREKGSKIL
ncbi:MAG: hypothetical protein ACK4S4_01515 [Pyrinomonadaceae bacterium]